MGTFDVIYLPLGWAGCDPLSDVSVVWSPFYYIIPAWATTVTTWLMLVGTMLGMMYLGQSFRLNKVALGAMMIMCLLEYTIYIGGAGVVGVAMIPLLIGLSLVQWKISSFISLVL